MYFFAQLSNYSVQGCAGFPADICSITIKVLYFQVISDGRQYNSHLHWNLLLWLLLVKYTGFFVLRSCCDYPYELLHQTAFPNVTHTVLMSITKKTVDCKSLNSSVIWAHTSGEKKKNYFHIICLNTKLIWLKYSFGKCWEVLRNIKCFNC